MPRFSRIKMGPLHPFNTPSPKKITWESCKSPTKRFKELSMKIIKISKANISKGGFLVLVIFPKV